MEISAAEFLSCTKVVLLSKNIRHEIHKFDSGCMMIDIWYGDRFFVVQYEKTSIGFSEITKDTTPFNPCPDERFHSLNEFVKVMESIFG